MQGAAGAAGPGAAVFLAQAHQQGMKFLVPGDICREMLHKQLLQLFIGARLPGQVMAAQDPEGVGVHHKGGQVKGVKEDAVRGLRPDALDGQESGSQPWQVCGGHLFLRHRASSAGTVFRLLCSRRRESQRAL